MVWLDLLVVQGTLKSLLQHKSSKALILQCPAFFVGAPCTCVKLLSLPDAALGSAYYPCLTQEGHPRPALGPLSLLPLLGPTLDHLITGAFSLGLRVKVCLWETEVTPSEVVTRRTGPASLTS